MRTLVLLAVVSFAGASASAQGGRPDGSTVVLAGPGAIEGPVSLGLGYHANLRQRLFSTPSDSLGVFAFLRGSVGLSAEALYQQGLPGHGSPWLLGAGVVTRWDPAPRTWAVRPYFVPVAVGLYINGGAYSEGASHAVGIGNGFGIEVPFGAAAVAVEARSVTLLGSNAGGGIPVSIGLRF